MRTTSRYKRETDESISELWKRIWDLQNQTNKIKKAVLTGEKGDLKMPEKRELESSEPIPFGGTVEIENNMFEHWERQNTLGEKKVLIKTTTEAWDRLLESGHWDEVVKVLNDEEEPESEEIQEWVREVDKVLSIINFIAVAVNIGCTIYNIWLYSKLRKRSKKIKPCDASEKIMRKEKERWQYVTPQKPRNTFCSKEILQSGWKPSVFRMSRWQPQQV